MKRQSGATHFKCDAASGIPLEAPVLADTTLINTTKQVGKAIVTASLTVAVMVCGAIGAAPAEAADFSDTDGHWAEDYIDDLSDMGVLGGFPDGSFRPNAPVTRAQFATIANQVFELGSGPTTQTFSDVPFTHWAAGHIAAANSSGLVAGYPGGYFRPEQNVTRAQSLVVMVNGLQKANNDRLVPVSRTGQWLQPFRDANAVPSWATPGVATAVRMNVATNPLNPNWLEPNRNATRAEVAAFAHRSLQRMGALDRTQTRTVATSTSTTSTTTNRGTTNRRNITSQNVTTVNSNRSHNANRNNPNRNPPNRPNNGNRSNPRQPLSVRVTNTTFAGTRFPTLSTSDRTQYFSPRESHAFAVVTDAAIRSETGQVAIPFGSLLEGRLEPVEGGLRFRAEQVTIGNRTYPLAAQSAILRDIKDPRQTRPANVVGDAAIGAAAGAVLAGVTGDRAIATEEVLVGAAAGAAIGNLVAPRVVEIGPDTPMELRVTRDFARARQ
ncbi:MAG: S-layer homology domain-containing protein [Cyanobacteria bacterium P01_A01_bin.3]